LFGCGILFICALLIDLAACRLSCRLLFLSDCRILYLESIARVHKLSLSGYILYLSRMADQFFVQWPELQERFPRSTYAGRLY
jgi:beta-1,4-N-acetylglucosaminyltransferase